ncbi:MAG: hypothetical protein AB8G05_23765 [Oligoflexales bacterium]
MLGGNFRVCSEIQDFRRKYERYRADREPNFSTLDFEKKHILTRDYFSDESFSYRGIEQIEALEICASISSLKNWENFKHVFNKLFEDDSRKVRLQALNLAKYILAYPFVDIREIFDRFFQELGIQEFYNTKKDDLELNIWQNIEIDLNIKPEELHKVFLNHFSSYLGINVNDVSSNLKTDLDNFKFAFDLKNYMGIQNYFFNHDELLEIEKKIGSDIQGFMDNFSREKTLVFLKSLQDANIRQLVFELSKMGKEYFYLVLLLHNKKLYPEQVQFILENLEKPLIPFKQLPQNSDNTNSNKIAKEYGQTYDWQVYQLQRQLLLIAKKIYENLCCSDSEEKRTEQLRLFSVWSETKFLPLQLSFFYRG